ncbi:MAG: glycosyltransferase family 2 protein [Candidatus Omnitrophota bacterium]
MPKYKAHIIVLNYEGRDLLAKYLPSIVEAVQASSHPCRVTVLDNCSTDGSLEFVRKNFPTVLTYRPSENRVLCSFNELASQIDDDIVILLNNDLKVEPGFVDPLVKIFEDHEDALFASAYSDRAMAKLHWGILAADIHFRGCASILDKPSYTVNTGMGAFHRKRFLALGGYDPLFLPGRYEDLDLCFRGWQQGWKGYYVPQSKVHHEGGTSFNKFYSEKENEKLVFRNSLFFMLKNISSPLLLLNFYGGLLCRLAFYTLTGKFHLWSAFTEAFAKRSRIDAAKRILPAKKMKDRTILRTINDSIRSLLQGAA